MLTDDEDVALCGLLFKPCTMNGNIMKMSGMVHCAPMARSMPQHLKCH